MSCELMPAYPILRNAPIVEAIVDVRVFQDVDFSPDRLKLGVGQLGDAYTEVREKRVIQSRFEHRDSEVLPSVETKDGGLSGVHYGQGNGQQIIQFNRDGYIFNRLKPYVDWESTRFASAEGWGTYKELVKPVSISRIGLRYINKIPFNLSREDPGAFVNLHYLIPEGIGGVRLEGFVYQTVIQCPERRLSARYTLAREKTVDPNEFSLIIDLDVFSDVNELVDQCDPFDKLELMRGFKNDLFFKSLTDKGVARFR